MDPRTFLRPPALDVRPAPAVGEPARPLPVELEPGRPAAIAFLRHAGCPFAERTVQLLRDAAIASPEVRWLAISHATAADTERWTEAIGGSGAVTVLSDPSRSCYAAWGLDRTPLGHFMGRRSLEAAVGLARDGIRNRHPSGSRWQSAGTFALDRELLVRWRMLPSHAGDLPDLDAALAAAR